MSILLVILGVILLLAAFVGCVLPVLPGPALAFGALLLLAMASGWTALSNAALIAMALAAAVVTALDYLLPPAIAKRAGASRAGIWGSVVGMVAGALLLPPFGAIIGAFAGAVLAELLAQRLGTQRSTASAEQRSAFRAGMAVFIGTLLGVGAKLAYTGVASVLFVRAL